MDRSVGELVVQLARDNRTCGYKRIAGVPENLGHHISLSAAPPVC